MATFVSASQEKKAITPQNLEFIEIWLLWSVPEDEQNDGNLNPTVLAHNWKTWLFALLIAVLNPSLVQIQFYFPRSVLVPTD